MPTGGSDRCRRDSLTPTETGFCVSQFFLTYYVIVMIEDIDVNVLSDSFVIDSQKVL